jgi:hypothetical protein
MLITTNTDLLTKNLILEMAVAPFKTLKNI